MLSRRPFLLSWILLLVLLTVWQVGNQLHWWPDYIIPSPLQILQAINENSSDLWSAFLSTLINSALGLALSVLIGTVLAILIFQFPLFSSALEPVAVFFQTVPIISIAPLLVIWFGFGATTVRAASAIVSFFPIFVSVLSGFQQTNPLYSQLFKLYRSNRWTTLWYLQWPSATPYFLAGLRTSSGLSVVGAIVGEFVAGSGLGAMIDSARTQQRVDLVFAAILGSAALGLFYLFSIKQFEKILLNRRRFS